MIKADISFMLGIDSNGSIVYEWDGSDGRRHSIVSSDGRDYADGRWHHIAIVRDGVRAVMYIDGRSVADREVRAIPVSNSYDIYINAMPDYSYTAKAMVDALGIWDKALSAEEVLALYDGDVEAMADAIVYESGETNDSVFSVNAGESISMRWYHDVDKYGRDVVIVLSNGIYMQSWQSISIFRASIMHGAHGAMYHEAFFGSNGL
ncbi:MAG: LamG domain-containing protein [Candidatus Nitrosocaldus sp.]